MTNKKYIIPAAAGLLALVLICVALFGKEQPTEPTYTPVDRDPAPAPVVPPTPDPAPQPDPTPTPQPAKYKRPAAEPGLCWSLEVAQLGFLDKNRDIYGTEFRLTEDKDGYEVHPGMGDCDKITGIRLYPDRLEVWLDADYKLIYGSTIPAYVALNQTEGQAPQETSQNWELTEGQPGEEHKITVYFETAHPAGTIFDLFFSYGKVD